MSDEAIKNYEYRFIMPKESDEPHEYLRGRVLKRKSGDVFRTYPYDSEKQPEEYPIEVTRKETDLSEDEVIDILIDWGFIETDGEPRYKSIPELTKDLRKHLYDDTKKRRRPYKKTRSTRR